jgi:hypothetical protein
VERAFHRIRENPQGGGGTQKFETYCFRSLNIVIRVQKNLGPAILEIFTTLSSQTMFLQGLRSQPLSWTKAHSGSYVHHVWNAFFLHSKVDRRWLLSTEFSPKPRRFKSYKTQSNLSQSDVFALLSGSATLQLPLNKHNFCSISPKSVMLTESPLNMEFVIYTNSSPADRRVNYLKNSDVSETHSVSILRESNLARCQLFKNSDVSETHSVSILRESNLTRCQLFKNLQRFRDTLRLHPQGKWSGKMSIV